MNPWRMVFVMTKREILRAFFEPSRLVSILAQPLLFFLILGFGFSALKEDYLAYFYVGSLALLILFTAVFTAMTFIEDRESGLVKLFLIAPFPKWSVVVGKTLGISLLALLQSTLFLSLYPFVIKQMPFDLILFLLFLWVGSFVVSSLSLFLAIHSSSNTLYHAKMSLILIPLWVLSGALFPLSGLMHALAYTNPMAWMISGMRMAFLGPKEGAFEGVLSSPWVLLCLLVALGGGLLCLNVRGLKQKSA